MELEVGDIYVSSLKNNINLKQMQLLRCDKAEWYGYTVFIMLFPTIFCLTHLKYLNKSSYCGMEDPTWIWLEYSNYCENKTRFIDIFKNLTEKCMKHTHIHTQDCIRKDFKNNCEDLYIVKSEQC